MDGWDRELDTMKKKVTRLKSKLSQDRTCEAVSNEFRETRMEYGRLIRIKKRWLE